MYTLTFKDGTSMEVLGIAICKTLKDSTKYKVDYVNRTITYIK